MHKLILLSKCPCGAYNYSEHDEADCNGFLHTKCTTCQLEYTHSIENVSLQINLSNALDRNKNLFY